MEELESKYLNFIENLEFDKFLEECYKMGFWKKGDYKNQRIFWGRIKDKQLVSLLKNRGVYIWGIYNKPFYVGIATKDNLKKRLSRYIGKNGIFDNAKKCIKGKEFKPRSPRGKMLSEDIAKTINNSKEIEKIWCIILPIKEIDLIRGIEALLITFLSRKVIKLLNIQI